MSARRTEPRVRCARYGLCQLPSGRRVYITNSGLMIGRRYVPPARDHGASADRVQDLVLHRRPLAWDQVWVTAMCVKERRP